MCTCLQIEQVQQARMQGEAAWKAYFQDVRTNAQKKWDTPQQDPLWHWVECDACKKWRLVSGGPLSSCTGYCVLIIAVMGACDHGPRAQTGSPKGTACHLCAPVQLQRADSPYAVHRLKHNHCLVQASTQCQHTCSTHLRLQTSAGQRLNRVSAGDAQTTTCMVWPAAV